MNTIKVKNIAELKTRKGTPESVVEVLGYYIEGDLGSGNFYWDALSTETDNGGTILSVSSVTTGRWKRVYTNVVNVKWFGAKGDGVTNDAVIIQKVLDYVNSIGGRVIIIPKGSYKLSAKLFIYSNTSLIGVGGAVFIYDDIADYGIKADNSFTNNVLLGSNITEGDLTITVATGTGSNFTVGGYIYIQETDIQFGYNFSGTYIGEVLSITGDILTLSKPVAYSFTTANTARVYYFAGAFDFYSNITIRNIQFECVTKTPTNFFGFIHLAAVNNVIIENNTFKNFNGLGVLIESSLNLKVTNNYFLNGRTGNAASISFSHCVAGEISENRIEKSSFGITASNSIEINVNKNTLIGYKGVFNGRGVKIQFNSKYCTISYNKITNTGYYAIYLADSNNNIVSENSIYNCGEVGEYAITSGGYLDYLFDYNIISKNIIVSDNTTYGILVYASGANARKTYNVISSNIIKNVINCINIFTSGNNIESNIITGAGVGQDSLVINTSATDNVVINNTVKNNGSGFAINSFNSAGNNFIVDNNTKNEAIILHATDNIGYQDNIIKVIDTTFNPASITATQYGGVFIKPTTGVNDNVTALTFGYNSNGSPGTTPAAGIYVQSSSSYGTRMILGTTSSFGSISSKLYMDEYGNVGLGTISNPTNTILNLKSTTKGFAPPRMTTTQKNTISSPYAGLMVYDTTLNKLCVYTTAWEVITSS